MSACIRAEVILGTVLAVLGIEALLVMGAVAGLGYARRRGWIE